MFGRLVKSILLAIAAFLGYCFVRSTIYTLTHPKADSEEIAKFTRKVARFQA